MSRSRSADTAALAVADAGLLVALWPQVAALARSGVAPRQWFAQVGADRALATVAGAGLWCVALWVGIGLLAAVAGRLPGTTGAVATALARRALPAALRRVVIGSAGLGVLLAPISPAAAGARPPDVPGGRPAVTASPLPGPSWPGSGADHRPSTSSVPPGPSWPGSAGPAHDTPNVPRTPSPAPSHRQQTPAVPNPTPKTPSPTTPHTHKPDGDHVTVRAGDCLWLLAARRLGAHPTDAEIARYVPALYAANRDVIGDDPSLVRPGQQFALPAPTTHPQERP